MSDIDAGQNRYYRILMPTTNTTTKYKGWEAIEVAERAGLTLNRYTSPIEEARSGLSVEEATQIAQEDPSMADDLLAEDDDGKRVFASGRKNGGTA